MLEMILKMMSSQNQPRQGQSFDNPAMSSYPKEAFSQSIGQGGQMGDMNGMLPLLLSLVGKGGSSLSGIMEGVSKKSQSPSSSADAPPDEEISL